MTRLARSLVLWCTRGRNLRGLFWRSTLLVPTALVVTGGFVAAGAQNCPSDNYDLTTQAQVDAFPGSCTVVSGGLYIGPSSDITDLSPLSGLTSVGANLWIEDNDALANIDGLSGITSIEWGLDIRWNDALTNIDGVSGLISAAAVSINNNAELTNVDGLGGITFLTYLSIEGNGALADLDGLSGLAAIGGLLHIRDNPALTNLSGLSSLTSVQGQVTILGNSALTDLDGLSSLTSVGPGLFINGNSALANLDGLSALTSIGDVLWVWGNAMLTDCSCGLYECVNSGGVSGPIMMSDNAVSGDCNNNGADLVAGQCSTVRIEQEEPGIPTEFALHSAYPNPFNPATAIAYDLPQAADVTLMVVDVLGRQISELASGKRPAGTYEVTFDATGLPSGIYVYRLVAGDYVETKRMVVVR